MNHAYKAMVASVGPVLYALRQQLADLLNMSEQMLVIDVSISLLVASVSLVLWCLCLYQMRDMALKVIVLMLIMYAALLSTHMVLVVLQIMASEHPDWHAAASATLAYYFNETVREWSRAILIPKE